MPRSVAIIGAGACGLAVAHRLRRDGFDTTIFEMGHRVGGLWCIDNDNGRSAAYESLHINTSKDVTQFTGFPFPDEVGPFPSHSEMHDYYVAFAKATGVIDSIRFGSPVTRLDPYPRADGSEGWRLEIADGRELRDYDAVVVASGHLSVPMEVEELASFQGDYLHSFSYRSPLPYAGRRCCIVGSGNSALDITRDLAPLAKSCVLVARTGIRILPKLIFGLPFTTVTQALHRRWVPGSIRRSIIRGLAFIVNGSMTGLGFRPTRKRAHVTSNDKVVTDIRYGRVRVKHEIQAVRGNVLEFSDGTSEAFDVLIAATGYVVSAPFVDDRISGFAADNSSQLFLRMFPPRHKNIAFAGFFNTDTALNMVFERQAQFISDHFSSRVELPPEADMLAEIRNHAETLKRNYVQSARHRLEEEHLAYFRKLDRYRRRLSHS